jgi:hypothetical protein
MAREAVFRGVHVELVQTRIKNRKPDRFYYEIRKSDETWSSPATLEEKVAVNFWGTMVSPQRIDFGEDDYLELTDAEMSSLLQEQEDDEASDNP